MSEVLAKRRGRPRRDQEAFQVTLVLSPEANRLLDFEAYHTGWTRSAIIDSLIHDHLQDQSIPQWTPLTPGEAEKIWTVLHEMDKGRFASISENGLIQDLAAAIFCLWDTKEFYTACEMGEILKTDRRMIARRLRVLQKNRLIRRTTYGFEGTEKLANAMKRHLFPIRANEGFR